MADYYELSSSREGCERVFELLSDSLLLSPREVACIFKLIALGIFIELRTS